MVAKLTLFIFVELLFVEAGFGHFEAVQCGRVVLLEGANKCLHVKLGIDFFATDINQANLDLVAKFIALFLCFRDAKFVAFAKFLLLFLVEIFWGFPESFAKSFEEVHTDRKLLAVFDALDPFFAFLAPVVGDWTGENLHPHLFSASWVELSESGSDACKRVNLEGIEGLDW